MRKEMNYKERKGKEMEHYTTSHSTRVQVILHDDIPVCVRLFVFLTHHHLLCPFILLFSHHRCHFLCSCGISPNNCDTIRSLIPLPHSTSLFRPHPRIIPLSHPFSMMSIFISYYPSPPLLNSYSFYFISSV